MNNNQHLEVILEAGVSRLVGKLEVKSEELDRLLDRGDGPPVLQGQTHAEIDVRLPKLSAIF